MLFCAFFKAITLMGARRIHAGAGLRVYNQDPRERVINEETCCSLHSRCSPKRPGRRNLNNLSVRRYSHYVEGSRDRCMARGQKDQP